MRAREGFRKVIDDYRHLALHNRASRLQMMTYDESIIIIIIITRAFPRLKESESLTDDFSERPIFALLES